MLVASGLLFPPRRESDGLCYRPAQIKIAMVPVPVSPPRRSLSIVLVHRRKSKRVPGCFLNNGPQAGVPSTGVVPVVPYGVQSEFSGRAWDFGGHEIEKPRDD